VGRDKDLGLACCDAQPEFDTFILMECWLRANYRVMLLGMVLPAALLVMGGIAAAGALSASMPIRVAGWVQVGVAMLLCAILIWNARLPRLAFQEGHLLVYLRAAEPIRVPVQYVECFFLGQAPSEMKLRSGRNVEVQTVVVRLAESATQWEHCDVKPALGSWCDGYITIHGTWCEPLTIQRVNQLNRRLAEVHRQQKSDT